MVSRASAPGQRNPPEVEAAFEAAPPDTVAEIIDGELHTLPRPRPRHARAGMRLASRLGVFDDEAAAPPRPGGWILLFEPELHFGPKPDKLVPDLAGWRRERFPAIELEESDAAAISIPPDWVCEILSEGTEALDRGKKRRIYARERVAWLWYVDPRDRTLEVWSQKDGRWHEVDTFEGDSSVRAPPFDAIEIDLGALWRW